MRKALLLYNPHSSRGNIKWRLGPIVRKFTKKNILLTTCRFTHDKRDAVVRNLKKGGYSFIIIAGGDGTLNQAVNLLYRNRIELPIGIIPVGTCNDFARSVGLPSMPPLNIGKCFDIILKGKTADIDLGIIKNSAGREQCFLNTCAGGKFVNLSFETNTRLKKSIGQLAYYMNLVGELKELRSTRVRIVYDTRDEGGTDATDAAEGSMGAKGDIIEEDILLFLALNGPNAAGFYNIVDTAKMSDGELDILIIRKCTHVDLARLLSLVIRRRPLRDRVTRFVRARHFRIESSDDAAKVSVSADGESCGHLPVTLSVMPKAIRVFVP